MSHSLTAGLKIVGTGRALPRLARTASELDRAHGQEDGFFADKTGVITRYFCTDETQIDLAMQAAGLALEDSGLAAADIDLIISAAAVPYQPIPSTAPLLQQRLGIADGACFAFDVNATCLGFPTALTVANGLLKSGLHQTILIVASELASRGLPWKDQPEVAGLFGDGAAAAVLRTGAGCGVKAARFTTYAEAYEACQIGAGGTRFDFDTEPVAFATHSKFDMNGKELFRVAARHFDTFVGALLADAGVRHADLDCVVAHQASPAGLDHMIRACDFSPEQVINIVADVGNQIAASIPFVLDYARRAGRIKEGNRIALLGTSAGVSFGGLVLEL
ncbi:MAG: 3-oxoacyl-[acyl-carrier-protein] synthase III C-terminal domain-containing protein [Pseudomonadota bacterium]